MSMVVSMPSRVFNITIDFTAYDAVFLVSTNVGDDSAQFEEYHIDNIFDSNFIFSKSLGGYF